MMCWEMSRQPWQCSQQAARSLAPALPSPLHAHIQTECFTHTRAGPQVLAVLVGSMDCKISQVGKGLGVSFATNSLLSVLISYTNFAIQTQSSRCTSFERRLQNSFSDDYTILWPELEVTSQSTSFQRMDVNPGHRSHSCSRDNLSFTAA